MISKCFSLSFFLASICYVLAFMCAAGLQLTSKEQNRLHRSGTNLVYSLVEMIFLDRKSLVLLFKFQKVSA